MKQLKNLLRYRSFQYNDSFRKWLWLSIEVLLSSFVGALIAFIFGDHYWAALIAFGLIIFFLLAICVLLVALENRVSVLSIMNQGLRDGRYEDVIKFGCSLVPALFNSNKNNEIILLGRKIDEAASKIQAAPYNKQKGDFRITIGDADRTISYIRIEAQIDFIGWPLHLCNQSKDSAEKILAGIKMARNEATRLASLLPDALDKEKAIQPYIKLLMRGYRHLTGIFSTDISSLEHAKFFENITRVIMSNGRILASHGVCNNRTENFCPDNIGGLMCSKDEEHKVACIKKNLLSLYFPDDNTESQDLNPSKLFEFLEATKLGYLSEADVIEDVRLFNQVSNKFRIDMIRDQCYAWSRNIVKQLQRRLDNQVNGCYISDDEIACNLAEALAFAQVYYFGSAHVPVNNGRDIILNAGVNGKPELRYLSLLNEISLVEMMFPMATSSEYSSNVQEAEKIEMLIQNFRQTMEICRGLRADLYVRNSLHLCEAYLIQFNLCSRYSMAVKNDVKKKQLREFQQKIYAIFQDIKQYEHKLNTDAMYIYKFIKKEIDLERKILNHDFSVATDSLDDQYSRLFSDIDSSTYKQCFTPTNLGEHIHCFSSEELSSVREKWRQL